MNILRSTLLLSSAALALFPSPAAFAVFFPDLPSDQSLRAPIEELSDRGIVRGYNDGLFRPGRQVSWGEWIKLTMASRAIARGGTPGGDMAWAVSLAAQEGLITSSQPLDISAPRLEAIAFLAKAYGLQPPFGYQGGSIFVDVPASQASLFGYLAAIGLISGTDSTHLGTTPLLRQEAAKVISKALHLTPAANPGLSVVSPGMHLLGITKTSLTPGDSTSILFSVTDSSGSGLGGYTATDFSLAVLQGSLTVTSFSELGYGVYQYTLASAPQSPPGPIQIRILNLRSGTLQSLTIPDNSASATNTSSVRAMPDRVMHGRTSTITTIPRDPYSSAPVSGLTLSASVVSGSGAITQQMTESPVGSGIYVGEFTATGYGPATVRVTIESSATRPYADVALMQV